MRRLQQIWEEVPVVFLVAPLFYLFLIVRLALLYAGEELPPDFWYALLFLLAGLALTVLLCSLNRIAGIAFILLTAAGLCLKYFLPEHHPLAYAGAAAFPADVLIACFVLFFYKRLRAGDVKRER